MAIETSVPPPGPASKPPPAERQQVKLSPERARAQSRESLWSLRKALPRRYRVPFAVAMPAAGRHHLVRADARAGIRW